MLTSEDQGQGFGSEREKKLVFWEGAKESCLDRDLSPSLTSAHGTLVPRKGPLPGQLAQGIL
jgi:hypothetical protein